MSFESLGLSPELLRALLDLGYESPTPIQSQAIPVVLGGRDILAAAQTGTGKTAGFTLPILQRLQPNANTSPSPARHPIRCLILTPTRELAVQVEESVRQYSKYLPLRSTVLYGGVAMDPQIKALQAGVEILVATPGRLLDHLQSKTLRLSTASILVLDEADRMLDMGFIPDIKRILQLLPGERQTLLFSATFSDEIKRLSDDFLTNPVRIEVARQNAAADLVRQRVYRVHEDRKRELLVRLISELEMSQAIVFCGTKIGANKLCGQLVRDGINAAAIHSDKTQQARTESLASFKAGEVSILVATDVAARGLDIEQLPFVVNYDLPHVAEDYVHRIGRTGRAGSPGNAVSLVSPDEERHLRDIEKLLKSKVESIEPEGFQDARPARAARSDRAERGERPERAPRGEPLARAVSEVDATAAADTVVAVRAERAPRTERSERSPRGVESRPGRSNGGSRRRLEDLDPMAGVDLSAPVPSVTRSDPGHPASLPRPGRRPAEIPALLRSFPKTAGS